MSGDRAGIPRRLKELEASLSGILSTVQHLQRQSDDHDREDNRRFGEISARIDAVGKDVHEDIEALGRTLSEAIAGDTKTQGVREKLNTLQRNDDTFELRIKQIDGAIDSRLSKLDEDVAARFTKLEENRQWLMRMLAGSTVGWVLSMLTALLIYLLRRAGS